MSTHTQPAPQVQLSPADVRRATLRAQGLLGAQGRRGGVAGMLRRLGAVQLDTISVLARSHELVAYARLGPVSRATVETAYWHPRTPAAFEYWSHAACVLPIEEWPYYAFRRRAFRARGHHWHEDHDSRAITDVLARLRTEGPLTATQLGGAKAGADWWDWSHTKIAVEWLLAVGEVVCVRREGWRRVYDLPERALPAALLDHDLTDEECLAHLAGVAARALGVVTRADLVDYHRLSGYANGSGGRGGQPRRIDAAAEAAGLIPAAIEGAGGRAQPAWADPGTLAGAGDARGRHRVTLLSPFDSLVWDRKRTLRLFGFEHSLEAYVPKARRVHGYYTMPLLAGGKLVGRVDPVRRGRTLVARQVSLESAAAATPMAQALREAAQWAGCDSVVAEVVTPAHLAAPLAAAMATGAS